jgi:holin-like protein
MLFAILALLASLLFGELLSRSLSLPIPAAVLGMALLTLVLGFSRQERRALSDTAAAILQLMPLLYVPAGVGVMQYATQLQQEWLPITTSLIAGTLITLAVSAWCFRWWSHRNTQRDASGAARP